MQDRQSKSKLDPELRMTLDAIRVLAACVVVVNHLAGQIDFGIFSLLTKFGQEAVVAFFLLSGFVIHANERDRVAEDLSGYFVRRFFRIYPTLICAMLLTALVAAHQDTLYERFRWQDVACTLFGLQDASALKPGTICGPFLDNSPLWSLSYELLFYALYPIALSFFHRAPQATHHAVGITCLLCAVAFTVSPSHFLLLPCYFVIWWLGASMAEALEHKTERISVILWPLIYVFLTGGVWAIEVVLSGGIERLGVYPFLMVRHFAIAVIFVLIVLMPVGRFLARITHLLPASYWTWLASISYGVYVLHNPLLINWPVARSVEGFVFAFALLIGLSWLFDNRMNIAIRSWTKR